jgi:DNA-binding NtrC family response regulator
MIQSGLHLFIIDNDIANAMRLQFYLNKRFKRDLVISLFNSGAAALSKMNSKTNIVIFDPEIKDESGNELLDVIKKDYPKTEVILLTSNEDIGLAIESFKKGASDVILKNQFSSWRKLSSGIYSIITYPVRIMVKEFGVSKFVAIFLLTFFSMSMTVFFILKWLH